MKLNIKQTIYIGLGFLTIQLLWGVYNFFIPLFLDDFLKNLFDGNEILIGIIMALDNLVALFMIPLMSNLSDKTHTKLGKRMPFIVVGIILSAISFSLIPLSKESQNVFILLANIIVVLLAMNIYRSPCISLMPDVTMKVNRSKGNSIMNICGGTGTALAYLLNLILAKKHQYIPFFIVSGIMIVILIIMIFKVKENKMLDEYHENLVKFDIKDDSDDEVTNNRLTTAKRNVILGLLVVFLVYMANNAVETWLSLYSRYVFLDESKGTLTLIPFGITTFAAAVPAALVADKLGRRKAMLIGAGFLFIGYLELAIVSVAVGFSYIHLIGMAISGVGFSFITINSYPLIVEYCSNKEIGKYTGKYYTASMLAQSITPALSGLFISALVFNTFKFLFPYCAIFIALAILCLSFIKDN